MSISNDILGSRNYAQAAPDKELWAPGKRPRFFFDQITVFCQSLRNLVKDTLGLVTQREATKDKRHMVKTRRKCKTKTLPGFGPQSTRKQNTAKGFMRKHQILLANGKLNTSCWIEEVGLNRCPSCAWEERSVQNSCQILSEELVVVVFGAQLFASSLKYSCSWRLWPNCW